MSVSEGQEYHDPVIDASINCDRVCVCGQMLDRGRGMFLLCGAQVVL